MFSFAFCVGNNSFCLLLVTLSLNRFKDKRRGKLSTMSNVSGHFPHAKVMAHANVMGTATLHSGQSRF